jgi:transcriptional regulator with XRE-family HTH domain
VKLLKEIRTNKGLSQTKLAKLAGVSQPSIHYIETGRKYPAMKTVIKLAKALEVSVLDLMDEDLTA